MAITEDEYGTERGISWYVSRRVDVAASDLPSAQLPTTVTGAGGVTLTILEPIFVDDAQYRSFSGVLSFPGILPGKLRVEVDLNPYSSHFGEVGLRPARHAPRLLVSAERYFDGAWSVLDAIAAELSAAHDAPGQAPGAGRAA
ncbi:MAG TPA: hypothetical protein VND23_01440 [Acidimicrobiales bacterium]|nr:hypothetical protein [Acidimicrobiales bacterium]